jgi:nitrogen regulatory protein PII
MVIQSSSLSNCLTHDYFFADLAHVLVCDLDQEVEHRVEYSIDDDGEQHEEHLIGVSNEHEQTRLVIDSHISVADTGRCGDEEVQRRDVPVVYRSSTGTRRFTGQCFSLHDEEDARAHMRHQH